MDRIVLYGLFAITIQTPISRILKSQVDVAPPNQSQM